MVGIRRRGEQIRQFILDNVEHHPKDIAAVTAQQFGISRQAINKHIQRLVDQKSLMAQGTSKSRYYVLHALVEWEKIYHLSDNLEEDRVWREDISPLLENISDNVMEIWHYCFTEIFNNAIDHSGGKVVGVHLKKTAIETEISIFDDGEGIFKKIQRELRLNDERHAVLELSKGKLTTDPKNHSGEGIFFSSRMVDDFRILSGSVYFSHKHNEVEDWIIEQQRFQSGTNVFINLRNNTSRNMKAVFDNFTSGEDYGFTKTVVPVRLVQYGNEKLVSRSQAKRLLARVDKFKVVLLDFDGVDSIGQAFADEVFRVFKLQNPAIDLVPVNFNEDIKKMISRALNVSD